jgi:hypothetical protein
LGNDPSSWNRYCPLPKPEFFSEALAQFILAFKAAEHGDSDLARKLEKKLKMMNLGLGILNMAKCLVGIIGLRL